MTDSTLDLAARRGLRRAGDTPLPLDPAAAALQGTRAPVALAPEQVAAATQDTSGTFSRGIRRGAYELASAVPALYGAGRNLVSPGSGDAALETAVDLQRQAQREGPEITSTSQVHDAGSAAGYLAGTVGTAVPGVVTALLGGGIGGAAAKGVARRAALDAAEGYAARKAAESGAGAVARGAVERVAPRFAAAADEAIQPTVTAARAAGTVVGQYPSVIAGSVEGAPDANGDLTGGLKGAGRADTAKILLGDLGASALGALPEFRLLQRAGGTAAAEAIANNAKRILPRIAAEAAKQGALGGGLGAAQTAAQFATHKWVNDNVDLLSPAAFQSYLDSAVAGAALGAGLGGAVEGGAALGARFNADGTPNPQWAALKQRLRDNIDRAGKKSEEAFTKARGTYDAFFKKTAGEGEPVQPTEAAGEPAPAARTTTEAAQEFGTKIGEGGAKLHQAALDMFERITRHLSDQDARQAVVGAFGDAVDSLKDRFDTAPLQAGLDAAMKSYSDAMKRAKTPEAQADVQKAYGKVFEEHVTDAAPDVGASFAENLNRVQDDAAIDDRADSALERMSQRFESGEADALAPNQRSPKQNPVELDTPLQRQLGAAIPVDAPIWSFPEALKPLMSSAEKLFTGAELSARDHANLDILRRYAPDKVDEWEIAGPRYHELTKGADEAHASADEGDAQAQRSSDLRAKILRDGGANGDVLVENRSGRGADFWRSKDPHTNANTIGTGVREVQLANGTAVRRQTALQLDNLISKKLAEDPGIGPKAAMLSVLGDLKEAGIDVQPETITPGRVYTSQSGETFNLSPREAAAIRASLEGRDRTTLSPAAREAGALRRAIADSARSVAAAEAALENNTTVDALAKSKTRLERPRVDEQQGEADSRVPGPERVPREAPPQGTTGVGTDQTSTLSNVGDVRLSPSPYERVLTRARQARDAAASPRERGQIVHEAGVEIGKAELAKERDAGTINDRRYAAELKRLEDPASGASRKYFIDARDGKFDRAAVRETSADNPTPTPRHELEQASREALDTAYRRMTGTEASSEPVPRRQLGRIVERLNERAQRGETLEPKERTFLSAARDAGYKVDLGDQRTPAAKARDEAAAKQRPTSEAQRLGIDMTKDAAERRLRNLPENPRPKVKAADEQVMEDLSRRLNDIDEAVSEVATNDHIDFTKETRLANDTLAALGIKDTVRVAEHDKATSGSYVTGSRVIELGNNLRGAERVQVLAHELGHHIIRSELAKAMGVPLKDIENFSIHDVFNKMEQHQPELHAAVLKDFEAWMEKNSSLDMRYTDVIASRKPFQRAENIRTRNEAGDLTMRDIVRTNAERADYVYSFEEYFADQISRALTHSDRSKVGKFFKAIADKLKLAYETLFKRKGGKEYAPAPSVQKWVRSLFDRTTRDVSEALGRPVSAEQARTATQAALHVALSKAGGGAEPPKGGGRGGAAPGGMGPEGLKALVQFIRTTLPKSSRQVLDTALSNGRATQVLERIYADRPGALKAMRDPKHALEAKIAYAYLAWRDGKFVAGKEGTSAFKSIGDQLLAIVNLAGEGTYAERVFNDIQNGRIAQMVKYGREYDVRAREAAYRGKAQAIANEVQKAYERVRAPLGKVFTSSIERMRQTGVPAIRRAGALLQRHTGEAGEDPGMLPATTHVTDRFMRAAGAAFEGLNDREILHALTALQRQDTAHFNPKVDASTKKVRALFDQFHAYARAAGVDLPKRENYFPVMLDVRTAEDAAKLRTLLEQPKFENAIRRVLNDQQSSIGKLIDRMVSTQRDPADGGVQEFNAKNYRLMNFIYELGDDADKKTFASLQSKSPADIFARYVQPLVREAEFTRRFGPNGEKLERLVLDARAQGANDADIAQLRAAVDGARGRIGVDGSPTIRALFGKAAAEKVKGAGVRKGVSYLQAYQNARLLPLSLFSSLVDPMGIAVRTGGDFKTAWQGFKVGMKSLTDKATRDELKGMLRALGSADDFLASDILSSNFGRGEGGARKINDFIFHANGLAAWTRTTRFMALQSAHQFLLKHADGSNATSKRYLDELGVRPGDVKRDANGRVQILSSDERASASPAARAADDRVRNALLRFVDEAVLRPTSQQAPNWFADPYVGLVTQYKHFAYAIQDQIGKRILQEVRHGNVSAILPAMAYLPIIIATEMIRGLLQYGPGGNPNRDDWGPEEYTAYALDRSGLLGPKLAFQSDAAADTKHGNLPGTSFLGPTVQQGQDLVRTAAGRGSIGRAVENALPAEALFKHWNDGATP